MTISIKASEFAENFIYVKNKRFSFDGYEQFRASYDSAARGFVYKTGRQVAKCLEGSTEVLLINGQVKKIWDLEVGDELVSFDGLLPSKGVFADRRWAGNREVFLLKTRQGHSIRATGNHPLRTLYGWTDLDQLVIGGRIAVVRKAGEFGTSVIPHHVIKILAWMIAEGGLTGRSARFTNKDPLVVRDFGDAVHELDKDLNLRPVGKWGYDVRGKIKYSRSNPNPFKSLLKSFELTGTSSFTKFIPPEIFNLPRKETALFINRLWGGDGTKFETGAHDLSYCSISERLIYGLQRLLWKFGIPSKVKSYKLKIYEKRLDGRMVWKLRIETAEGLRKFIQEIGAFNKILEIPSRRENNNRDTVPIEIEKHIKSLDKPETSLNALGLRRTLKYPLSKRKLEQYLEAYSGDSFLKELRNGEVYWDEILSIESAGFQDTYHIQVDDLHNFVCDGIISHNSTTLANRLITWCCTIPYFSALVVTPVEAQLSVFSKQKLAPVLNSPFIKKHFYSANKTDQIFYKQLSNGSDVTLRSCFIDPETIRGISSDAVCVDEIQDILTDNIPVIQECYTRSDYKYAIYSGTPKTNQHSIEHFWNQSTQFEWIVKCNGCNHYNYIDESCVQPYGLSCSKCAKLINAQEDGQWVSFDTSGKNRIEGYRIPQLIIPWIPWTLDDAIRMYGDTADEQGTIWGKYKNYSRTRFYNEVAALPYDNALCPIVISDLVDACDPQMKMCESKNDSSVVAKINLVAGLDHSTSQDSASYTVLTIGGFVPGGRFVVVYAKRYVGIEADVLPMLKHVAQKLRDFGVTVVTSDWGSGATNNVLLREELHKDGIQLIEVNHSGTQKADATWSAKAKMFTINRTHVLTEIFNKIKHKDIVFPNWDQMQTYLTDLLNIYTDYNESLRTVFYNKPQNKPDDYLHALTFAHFGATIQAQS